MNEIDCVFCGITARRIKASIVFEDDVGVCFMDTEPVNPGHVLVVPKRHATDLSELDDETAAHLLKLALRVQRAIRKSSLKSAAINCFVADGEAAGQEVFHFHLLVFPRYAGDAFQISYDWSTSPSRGELDEAAEMIRAAL